MTDMDGLKNITLWFYFIILYEKLSNNIPIFINKKV